MQQIGSYEAKTHLPKLLDRVQKGERFVITKHGHPVAELIPVTRHDPNAIRQAIQDLKDFRSKHSLGGLSVRDLITEGRKR